MVLPSFDFDIEIVEDVVLRASFSETITRPSYNDIKGGLTANSTQFYANQNAFASSGNPDLEPILAWIKDAPHSPEGAGSFSLIQTPCHFLL